MSACWHTADVVCPNCSRYRGSIGYAGPACYHCYCMDQLPTTGMKAHIVCCKCGDRRLAAQTTCTVVITAADSSVRTGQFTTYGTLRPTVDRVW